MEFTYEMGISAQYMTALKTGPAKHKLKGVKKRWKERNGFDDRLH